MLNHPSNYNEQHPFTQAQAKKAVKEKSRDYKTFKSREKIKISEEDPNIKYGYWRGIDD
jgi:hypothetical protein